VKLCNVVLQMPDLATDPRFANEEVRMSNEAALMAIVRAAIAEKPTSHWAGLLREADIMHERLNTFREFLRQPQAEAINLISWLDIAGAPEPVPVPNVAGIAPLVTGTPHATTPVLGQHTSEVLREHGYSSADVAALIEQRVVSQA
jgi:crotonobetainyl-CoA:carnitine CoA-transferase CaiB-like acyl-CoA transferase